MKLHYFIIGLLLAMIWSCSNGGTTDNNTDAPVETETNNDTKLADRTTLEGFWTALKQAVADKDEAAVLALYAPDASTHKLYTDADYMKKIAESVAADVQESGEFHEGEIVYQFMMLFPPPPELEEAGLEASSTTIYIKKNAKGEFEIFNVLEAG